MLGWWPTYMALALINGINSQTIKKFNNNNNNKNNKKVDICILGKHCSSLTDFVNMFVNISQQ